MRAILLLSTIVLLGAAAPVPRISHVTLTTAGDGTYNATITGLHFGAPPASVPCNVCTPLEVQIRRTADLNAFLSMNVTAWSDTEIDLTGVAANPGDSMEIAIYNDTLQQAAAAGGLVSRVKGLPKITQVTATGTGQAVTLTITGSGFGPAPAVVGGYGNSPYLAVSDYNATLPGTDGYPFNAGFCGQNNCDGVTVNYVSWTDTQIVLGGFGGGYGTGNWYDVPRDAICVAVWNSQSTSNGTTGANARCTRLPKQ